MKDTIRTFIAVKIIPGNELKSFFGKVKNTFPDESINWVDENNADYQPLMNSSHSVWDFKWLPKR